MLAKYLKDDVLFVVPYDVRTSILKYLSQQKKFYRITWMSLEEFKEHYFYSIRKEEALSFLYEKTHQNISVLKEKLQLLYQIDPNKVYKSKKLQDLVFLYHLLEEKGFFEKDVTFHSYLSTRQVYILGYPYLEAYEEEMFASCSGKQLSFLEIFKIPKVSSFETVEDELVAVATQIKKLREKGILYRQIRLAGITRDYTYLLTRIFSLFHIPITGGDPHPLLATQEAKAYLEHLDSKQVCDFSIRKKIVAIENKLLHIPKTSEAYLPILKDQLMSTYLDVPYIDDAVKVVDFYHLTVEEDTYTFVLGFNQNVLPRIFKDEDYLSDKDKEEISMDSSTVKNQKYKKATLLLLKSLPNVMISYKKASLTDFFFPSSCILEEHLEVQKGSLVPYSYSQSYSALRLGEMFDTFLIYGEKHPDFDWLRSSFQKFPYRTYQHAYQKIPFYMEKEKPYYLSYSSLNDYALCKFKYYAKYILKLDHSEQTFSAILGNIYHEVLSHIYDASFDFEECFARAVSSYTLSKKEEILLRRLKKELLFIIPVIEEQDSKSAFRKRLFEQKIELPLGDNVILKGFVDKISFCELYGKTHYVIYDYKTGSVTLDLTHLDDGLFLQLPIYQVLVEKGRLLPNPSFTGFFYQQLLRPYKNQQEKVNHLKLRGYIIADEEAMQIFDETYEQSEVIQGLKMTANGFSKNSKILSLSEVDEIREKTYAKIMQFKKAILKGDFSIDPKRLKKENISCKYCPFQDVCFHDEKDIIEVKEKEGV